MCPFKEVFYELLLFNIIYIQSHENVVLQGKFCKLRLGKPVLERSSEIFISLCYCFGLYYCRSLLQCPSDAFTTLVFKQTPNICKSYVFIESKI